MVDLHPLILYPGTAYVTGFLVVNLIERLLEQDAVDRLRKSLEDEFKDYLEKCISDFEKKPDDDDTLEECLSNTDGEKLLSDVNE